MRNAILMMLLAVVSSSVAAEWVRLDYAETYTAYVDTTTIRKAGNTVKMWNLFDYRTPQVVAGLKPYRAAKGQNEYDCKEEQLRMLYVSFHSEYMGEGMVVGINDKPSKWAPIPPGSMHQALWKIACGKK